MTTHSSEDRQSGMASCRMEENMSRIAVDVVLLPDEAMTAKAIESNRKLVEKLGNKIVLGKDDCLPHISLAMGCIDERDVSPIRDILKAITAKNRLGELNICGIITSTNAKDEMVSVFEVAGTQELQRLHETVMKKLKPFFSCDITDEMLYGNDAVAETTLEWISNYPVKSSFEHFMPHITIGYGQAQIEAFPIPFRASRLALCHLGNHCTCRMILAAVDL